MGEVSRTMSTASEESYVLLPREPLTDARATFHYTDLQRSKPTRENDPYEYMAGFGNRFQSEVIPGTLPAGQNNPQEVRFGLYTEGITYSAFAAPRQENKSTYMYRVRPAAAHNGYHSIESPATIESCFLSLNPKISTLPQQVEWTPFPIPPSSQPTDFIDGLHTLCGSGDANLKEGIALHIYTLNTSMTRRAFCNTDGDMLICPQEGNLDVQTEMGLMFVQPGEIFVIPRGVRFLIRLAGEPTPTEGEPSPGARGYITEIWGSSWELPDLGPIGGHGLANPRDFLVPVAHIDELDELHANWEVVCKLNGKLEAIGQDHSPFDLVAWHGNVVPYKYDLTKFSSQNSTSIDHTDPSINTVLTAKSSFPHVPLCDFLWFGPRWDAAANTFRLPYFHRNSASEFLACLYGNGLGRSDDFKPGGGSFEGGHTPHGGNNDGYVNEMKIQKSEPRKILENQMTIMIESSRTFLFTEWARTGCGTMHVEGTDPRAWDRLPDKFSAYPGIGELLQRVKEDKRAAREREEYYHNPKIGRFV
ncbi:RmlC-like cupin domain-containing protein [Cadophora sp. MPI-SDFR-AT-0126]|nr:RmlC-like cupin domain-containing protein [Leotiomycetes sp. MPI-SDFR-AT-0126]